ncbi:MAG: hypothetical protein HOQ01_05850 [Lysobacter sp.]|nr:hypothetical protein [Lysobacter sp.]
MRVPLSPIAAAFLLVPAVTFAGTPDPVVKAHLDALEYQYELTDQGDYKVVFKYEDERTQLVFIGSAVETYGEHRVREIWAPAYKSEQGTALPGEIANRLLESSSDLKLGAWTKADAYAVFVVKLPADASKDALDDALEVAGVTADDMEAELTPGKDEF